jgi:formylglycine-generating enzyme required for sulfatase activity/TolB-like protein
MQWKQPIRIAMNALVALGMQTMPAVALPADTGESAALIAVHDFSSGPALTGKNISGWWIAEAMENKFTQIGRFRIITRAKISKVLKEKNITSDGSLPPQDFGKLAGAQYIVTGQADYAAGKLRVTASLIHISEKTGEIGRSFEACRECREDEIGDRFPELIGELAKKLSMTPGEFLDFGLGAMNEGDFETAVSAFTELSRGPEINRIAALAAKVPEKNLQEQAMRIVVPGNTPGEMLDYSMMLLNKGDAEQAALVFFQLQQSKLAGTINRLMQVAKDGQRRQEELIGRLLAEARQKFEAAIVSNTERERQRDPAVLCDEAIARLQAFLSNPGARLGAGERRRIVELITEIETFRKKLFAGPSPERNWLVPGLNLELLPVQPGSFKTVIAGPEEDALVHPVEIKISRPFWIGKHEVTAEQFQFYLKNFPVQNRNDRYELEKEIDFESPDCPLSSTYRIKTGFSGTRPMTSISWRTARQFCSWLNGIEQAAGRLPEGYEYRLPTEAEWEYACRAGAEKAYCFGDRVEELPQYAYGAANSDGKTQPVGQLLPNSWGLHDSHGNVWEWCSDWYGDHFAVSDAVDPVGPDASPDQCKVARGGSYTSQPEDLKCAARYGCHYKKGRRNIGFRVVCAPVL